MVAFAYLIASVCFVLSLSGLSAQTTARRGNLFGIAGMTIAIVATMISVQNIPLAVGAMVVGGAIGAVLAARVAMTSMPELVALLHSFVGLGAVLVGWSGHLIGTREDGALRVIHLTETWLGIAIGAITLTGSLVAFGKLRELIRSKALVYPGRHAVTASLLVGIVIFGVLYSVSPTMIPLGVLTALACVLGILLVMAIGGADMPVVVSMLNSYSGWAAAATGFLLGNDVLIIVGALVGSSGAILSYIMCKAMNRSIVSVILGGFGAEAAVEVSDDARKLAAKGVRSGGVDDAIDILKSARTLIIVPGYGMAVAQAQHSTRELTELLEKGGTSVRYAIHPVAGRLPGHMNVLLAEANVPYSIVVEMDEINADFASTDAVLVLGANDIVNPGALEDPTSPIAGMPVLEVWRAQTVIAVKRSLNPGFAGIDNPLYYRENTLMVFGDARKTVEAMVAEIKASNPR